MASGIFKMSSAYIRFLIKASIGVFTVIPVFFTGIIMKARLFKYIENFTFKNWNFLDKNWHFFHISAQNIDCWYSLELPRWGGSNEYPQSMFWTEIRPTGDQEVAGSTPAEVGNILSWRLIMKYFLRSFSPFRWFKKGSCQFLAKECAQYWLTA